MEAHMKREPKVRTRRPGSRPTAPKRPRLAAPRTRLAGALHKLEEALANDPRDLGARVRAFVARFHQYSPLNRALIFSQKPDATFVAGRTKWLAKERDVKPGARAIFIVAPVLGPDQKGATSRFERVKVYDVSDTVGAPFEPPSCAEVHGDDERIATQLGELERWVRESGLELRYEARAINGLVDGATNGTTIWVRPAMNPGETLATLAHEIAHVKLHFKKKDRGAKVMADHRDQCPSRDVLELEAELTAFLMLEFSGIDSSRGSAAYLNCWNASKSAIRAHAGACLKAAMSVLGECERKRYRNLVEERSPGAGAPTSTIRQRSQGAHVAASQPVPPYERRAGGDRRRTRTGLNHRARLAKFSSSTGAP
jgi:hypothetical protein